MIIYYFMTLLVIALYYETVSAPSLTCSCIPAPEVWQAWLRTSGLVPCSVYHSVAVIHYWLLHS